MSDVLVVSNNSTFLQAIEQILKKSANTGLSYKHYSPNGSQSSGLNPLLVLIDLSDSASASPANLQKIIETFPKTRIVGAGHPSDVQQMLEYMKLGVKDFVSQPLQDSEMESLLSHTRLANASAPPSLEKPQKSAKIVTLFSPKGGAGVTLLTTNLAIALAAGVKNRVAIFDLSQDCGDVCTFLNLAPIYTVRDAIDNTQVLDRSFLDGIMIEHSSGVRILPAPREDQVQPGPENIAAFKSIIQTLKQYYEYVLIDAGHCNPSLLHFLWTESELILLLGNPDVASLKGLVNLVRKLNMLHYDPEKIKVIINRHNSKNQVDSRDFEKMTQLLVSFYLPNNYDLCIQAVNTGKPINEINSKSELARKIGELAEKIKTSFVSTEDKTESYSFAKKLKKGIF